MVRILVLGATGYIGLATCRSLRRSSHHVYGLARTPEKAVLLRQNEIIPIIGTVEGGEYLTIIESANIDVVVDAAGANTGSFQLIEGLEKVGKERLDRRGGKGSKLGFVYTSGMWVHGNSKGRVNDLNPVGLSNDAGTPTAPTELTKWRPGIENAAMDADDVLDVLILRPALLYGGSSAIWSSLFGALKKAIDDKVEKVTLPADPEAVLSLIHVDDTALALHKAVERVSMVAHSSVYPIFDAVSTREPIRPILEAAARAMGFTGQVEYTRPDSLFEKALSTSLVTDQTRMRDLLGWRPERVTGMLDEIEVYVDAWLANQEIGQGGRTNVPAKI